MNNRLMNQPGVPSKLRRRGFTLVEILVVIAIIGILAGIAIPAITRAITAGNKAAIRAEVEGINQAVEAYKLKYGDYPPDFSSWPVVQAHYRKIIPDIALSELTLLFRLCDDMADNNPNQLTSTTNYVPSAMDRAEAIVWSLGGLSSDPQLPFTGSGGPLVLMPTVPVATSNATDPKVWQYNSARDNALLDFKGGVLSLSTPDSSTAISFTNRVQSTDDFVSPSTFLDIFPVYKKDADGSPYVYFDSRTYRFDAGGGLLNGFATVLNGDLDAVRPVLSDRVNANLPVPSASSTTYGSRAASLNAWEFMNPITFQVLSPGIDGRFGMVVDFDGGTAIANAFDTDPVYWQYPTGKMIRAMAAADDPQDLIVPNVSKYALDTHPQFSGNPQRPEVIDAFEKDNTPGFGDSTFEDDLKE